jgi:hypothetical protein
MKVTIQYIPLHKIKSGASVSMTDQVRKLRGVLWDCMHLLAVRRHKKSGHYIVVSGHKHYEFLRNHTNKKRVPCIVEKGSITTTIRSKVHQWRNQGLLHYFPKTHLERLTPSSASIIRSFLKQEPRFKQLSPSQQIKVLILAVRYKKTVKLAMYDRLKMYLDKP